MLRSLAIRNLAVIEAVQVEFAPAFNVLTGETGAGKSILIEAVGLLLGGRAFQDLVRTGEDLATVEAVFDAPGGGVLTLRREISVQGRSRALVDGAPATAAQLRDLAAGLVELHGQHEHQALLDPDTHLPVLDTWAGLEADAGVVRAAWHEVAALRAQLDRLRMDGRERAARLELVEFQLAEIASAAVQPGEDEALAAERQVLRSADRLRQLCAEAYADLYEREEAALVLLGRAWKRVGELAAIDPAFGRFLEERAGLKAQLEDLAFTLRDYAARIDLTPGRLQAVEDRLALLERLKRRHGPTLEEVRARQAALEAEREALVGGQASQPEVEARLAEAARRFLAAARALSAARRAAAPRFAAAVEAELAELAMPRTRFELRLATDETEEAWSPRGIDAGEFFLSPNPGEDPRPLARIASGGELSRVMLALKTLAASDHQIGRTLIFDEVDAGIGGRAAAAVGRRLRALGERFQVLCITHLPQIAAAGQAHFHVDKVVRGSRTVTRVARLDEAGRVDELARMMGGEAATDPLRASARDLLARVGTGSAKAGGAKGESESGRRAKAKVR